MNPIISHLITAIISAIIAFFFIPLKKIFFDRYTERCTFRPYGKNAGEKSNQVINITKKFGKTTHIDCGHWAHRELRRDKKGKYYYCSYGDRKNNKGKCPFG